MKKTEAEKTEQNFQRIIRTSRAKDAVYRFVAYVIVGATVISVLSLIVGGTIWALRKMLGV